MRTDIRSARPRLLRLDNALLLLAIRPSLSLWTSVDGVSWSAMTNLAKAHNDALPQDSPLRFCPEFAASNHSYTSNGHIAQDTWMSTGYSSLVRLSGTEAMACYVREAEHSLPSQWQPPLHCRQSGPLYCMRISVSINEP